MNKLQQQINTILLTSGLLITLSFALTAIMQFVANQFLLSY